MIITRQFTHKGEHPFDTTLWKNFTAELKDSKGNTNFLQENVEFPANWSQQAVNICASKYFYGTLNTSERETSLKQICTRIADTITKWGKQQNYFDNDESAEIFRDELMYMIIHQHAAFNSPVWFNVGNPYSKPQISACYIVGVEDNLEDILNSVVTEGKIFKYGSGSGSNRSKIRSSKETISGGGKPSGPHSFMEINDAGAKAIKSGGKVRRAAKMEIIDIDHGDVVEFIEQKSEQEKIAKILIANGYSADFDDPKGAYSIVKFQQSNQSVSFLDSFMEGYENKEDYCLLARTVTPIEGNRVSIKTLSQGVVVRTDSCKDYICESEDSTEGRLILVVYKSTDLMRKISENAWASGDPGVQFQDTINKWHTCKNSGKITASNPCSEYLFLDDTSCNLASLRLTKFYNNGKVDIKGIIYTTELLTIAMDIMIDKAHFPTEKIKKRTREFRALGIGYADLGALLMKMGLAYDSDEARNIAASITALIHASAYMRSAVMAEELGAFQGYEVNKEPMKQVLSMHLAEMSKLYSDYKSDILEVAVLLMKQAYNCDKFRNAQVTVLAPTGTISFVMDCDTTGVEPMFGLVTYKTMAGGGFMKIVNKCVEEALRNLGYDDLQIKSICDHIEENGTVEGSVLKNKHKSVFATAVGTDNMIHYMGHIKMMAAIQPFLSGAISKTVNLPNSATIEDIEDIYVESWKSGLKCVALYRDGCKQSQPLSVKKDDKKEEAPEEKTVAKEVKRAKAERHRMNKTRPAEIHKFSIGGHEGYLMVGHYEDGQPGEIFIKMSKEGSTISGMMDNWAIAVSMLMQTGYSLEDIISKFENTKFEPAGWTDNEEIRTCTSPMDYVVKYLRKNYLEKKRDIKRIDEEIKESAKQIAKPQKIKLTGDTCNYCGNPTQKTGTCSTCIACGETSGCG